MNLWIALPLLALGLIFVIFWQLERRRTEQIHQTAYDLGLEFSPKGSSELQERLGGFDLFSRGGRRRLTNLLYGDSDNVDIAIFDYAYTVGGGQHSSTYKQSVISFRSEFLQLPQFTLGPEGLFSKIGNLFGYQDIDFPSHPGFSSRYLLRGEAESEIRELFSDAHIAFFEQRQKVCVQAHGDELIYFRQAKRIKPHEVKQFLEEGFEVYAQFRVEKNR